MVNMKRVLAIDIGAGSGRHIIGFRDSDGTIKTEEVYRFDNSPKVFNGHLIWDIEYILNEVVSGIKAALGVYKRIESLAIDTWGVDYVLMRGDQPVSPCYCYRDGRTAAAVGAVHDIIPFNELYAKTGIQFQPFNTLYQLFTDKTEGRLEGVSDFLMLPEYLAYRLTGVKKKEYTNATTTGLVNVSSKAFDSDIYSALGLPENLFGELKAPGETVGELLPDIADTVGGKVTVKLCASHDTASAFESVDLVDDEIFISSGTWALMGVKLESGNMSESSKQYNFTNEGGNGYIRFLKNLMGMWVLRQLKGSVGRSYQEMMYNAMSATAFEVFDINAPRFSAPVDMLNEVKAAINRPLFTVDEILNSVYHSLAASYARAAEQIELITGKKYNGIIIVGGGAKDGYLCRLIGEYAHINVKALPIEATALGNIKVQL
jgi:rhamnulokinase